MQTRANRPVLVRRCVARGVVARREVGRAAEPEGPAAVTAGARTPPAVPTARGAQTRAPAPPPPRPRRRSPKRPACGCRRRGAPGPTVYSSSRPRLESPGLGAHLGPASERRAALPGGAAASLRPIGGSGARAAESRAPRRAAAHPGPLPAATLGPLRQASRAAPRPGGSGRENRRARAGEGRAGRWRRRRRGRGSRAPRPPAPGPTWLSSFREGGGGP